MGNGIKLAKCKCCGDSYFNIDSNSFLCLSCRKPPCEICGKPVKVYTTKTCSQKCYGLLNKGKTYEERYGIEVATRMKEARKGENNVSKRKDVRIKLSERASRRQYFKHPYEDSFGIKYASREEVQVAEIIRNSGYAVVYEERLKLKDSRYIVPDFSIVENGKLLAIVEFSGAGFSGWIKKFKDKIRRVRESFPNLKIIVITYSKRYHYYLDLFSKYKINLYTLDGYIKETPTETLVLTDDRFNFDYLHFLPFHKGQCSKYHGHSSTLNIILKGYKNEDGMLLDFTEAKKLVKESLSIIDHKTVCPISAIKEIKEGIIFIEFESISGKFKFEIPEDSVCVVNFHSTVEHISGLLAEEILKKMPDNIVNVAVQMNEGVGKSAVHSCSIFDRDLGLYEIFNEEKLKTIIGFVEIIEMFNKTLKLKLKLKLKGAEVLI